MALSALSPAIERTRRKVAKKSTAVVLRVVPELKPIAGQQASDRLFFGVLGGILTLGLLGLLAINILLGNDAVKIKELKIETLTINEDREAALREVARLSTPRELAKKALELGMVQSSKPEFLDLSKSQMTGEN
jgi:hypothetical protein